MMLNDSSLTTPYLLLDKVKFRREYPQALRSY